MKGPTQCCVPTGLPAASALELSQPPAPVSRLLLLHRGHRGISLGSPVPPQAPEEWAFMNTDVFAGTKIDPGVLVQKLDPDTRSVASIRRGAEARAVLPKKEKLKLRRERWLQTFQGETWHRANEQTRERRARIFHVQQALGLPAVPLEIEAIKLAEQKRKAERRRRATVVVGDLQPLRDALPELLELEAGSRQRRARGSVSSRPRPSELSRMSAAQRLQLLEEERARFRELLASPTYRASPLLAIGQQLAQQMQLDGGSEL
ncbi:protein FAM207A isoform X3 [Ailuropoda melanoleuca]|uniref:protein FAM207A isoform X3 n=1 Tax=Ailuropoda melanoleuca TaxID=9646 RepID=UPI0014949E52|nr:protein FAM207A isoform X3 [Ailuropoda melanoleuca]